jgi:hypothetical protein
MVAAPRRHVDSAVIDASRQITGQTLTARGREV